MGLRKVKETVVVGAVLVSDSKYVSKKEVALSSLLPSFRIVERLQSEIGRGTRRTFTPILVHWDTGQRRWWNSFHLIAYRGSHILKGDLSFIESESKVVFREENMGVLFMIDRKFQRAHWRGFRS